MTEVHGGENVELRRYWRLLRYAARYGPGWALIAVVTLLSTGLTLLQPWPMQILVDHVLGRRPMSAGLARIAGLLPGAASSGGLLAYVAVAGLGIFAIESAVDVVLTVAWIRVGQ